MQIGKKYRVEFDDCCVKGRFESILKELKMSDDNTYPEIAVFENGVTLENCWCGTFDEI